MTTKTSTTKAETMTSTEKVQIPRSSSSSPLPTLPPLPTPSSSSSSSSLLHPGSFLAVAASFPDLIFPDDELKRAVDGVVADEEEEEDGAMVIGGAIRRDDSEDDDDDDDDDDDLSVEGDVDDGVSLFSGEEGAAEMALEMMIAMEIDVGAESQIGVGGVGGGVG